METVRANTCKVNRVLVKLLRVELIIGSKDARILTCTISFDVVSQDSGNCKLRNQIGWRSRFD